MPSAVRAADALTAPAADLGHRRRGAASSARDARRCSRRRRRQIRRPRSRRSSISHAPSPRRLRAPITRSASRDAFERGGHRRRGGGCGCGRLAAVGRRRERRRSPRDDSHATSRSTRRDVAPSARRLIAAARAAQRARRGSRVPGTVAAASTSGASATASASVVDGWPLACDANLRQLRPTPPRARLVAGCQRRRERRGRWRRRLRGRALVRTGAAFALPLGSARASRRAAVVVVVVVAKFRRGEERVAERRESPNLEEIAREFGCGGEGAETMGRRAPGVGARESPAGRRAARPRPERPRRVRAWRVSEEPTRERAFLRLTQSRRRPPPPYDARAPPSCASFAASFAAAAAALSASRCSAAAARRASRSAFSSAFCASRAAFSRSRRAPRAPPPPSPFAPRDPPLFVAIALLASRRLALGATTRLRLGAQCSFPPPSRRLRHRSRVLRRCCARGGVDVARRRERRASCTAELGDASATRPRARGLLEPRAALFAVLVPRARARPRTGLARRRRAWRRRRDKTDPRFPR